MSDDSSGLLKSCKVLSIRAASLGWLLTLLRDGGVENLLNRAKLLSGHGPCAQLEVWEAFGNFLGSVRDVFAEFSSIRAWLRRAHAACNEDSCRLLRWLYKLSLLQA